LKSLICYIIRMIGDLAYKELPVVSFVIPMLNEESRIADCLSSIVNQDYERDKIEILVIDANSKDRTVEIARSYGAKVFENKLKTSESGKAIGIKNATGQLICFIDGDNRLDGTDWLRRMVAPLMEDDALLGSEALFFTHRKDDGFIDRYCALIGMNDPLCLWLGSYDRMSALTGKWTGLSVETQDKDDYLLLHLIPGKIPTLGANGSIFRKRIFDQTPQLLKDYLFDTDILEYVVSKNGPQKFAKVKVGVVHLYCGSSLLRFGKKQLRRVKDYLYRRSISQIFIKSEYTERKYKYGHDSSLSFGIAILKFILSCVLFAPLCVQVVKGYRKKTDLAWFAHPILCWITLLVYGYGGITSVFNRAELSREKW